MRTRLCQRKSVPRDSVHRVRRVLLGITLFHARLIRPEAVQTTSNIDVTDRQSSATLVKSPPHLRQPGAQEARTVAAELGSVASQVVSHPLKLRAAQSSSPHLGGGVAKQKCGTCRFFQEASLAGSGWCHHPQRKVSSDVMIMVRRNELACRDEWSRSLWARAESSTGDSAPAYHRPQIQKPLPPAGADELRALAHTSERELPSSAGEDVLLSEARIIAEPHERASPTTPAQTFDVRSAVFKAREAYKERNRARDVAARKSEGATPLPIGNQERASEPFDRTVLDEPAPAGEGPRAASELPVTNGNQSRHDVLKAGAEEQRLRTAEPQRDHVGAQIGLEKQTSALETYAEHDDSLAWFLSTTPPEIEEADEGLAETEIQLTSLYRFTSEPLPEWFRTELPRMCRTCRDFRPTADGRRGWCANAWAFTHPRLVNEGDVAPCDSAFGDWWAAVDDVWLVAADVSNHTRPTPLLDRMVALSAPAKKESQGTS